jgi:hypothetical protein
MTDPRIRKKVRGATLVERRLSITKALMKNPKNGGRPPMFIKERNSKVDKVVEAFDEKSENRVFIFSKMALRIVADTIKTYLMKYRVAALLEIIVAPSIHPICPIDE